MMMPSREIETVVRRETVVQREIAPSTSVMAWLSRCTASCRLTLSRSESLGVSITTGVEDEADRWESFCPAHPAAMTANESSSAHGDPSA